MALAGGVRLRDDHAFEQRKATALAILDDLGPTHDEDSGKLSEIRRFGVELDAPGAPFEPLARFRYFEWWTRDGRGWLRGRYQYDYFDRSARGRLAYHRHDLPGGSNELHLHCEPSGGRRLARHFRAYEVDLLEAHEEFAALYLGGRPIDCAGLRPLRVTVEGVDA